MPRIDYYVKSLERFGANAVVLASGANVTLRFAAGDRYASQTTPHAELVALVEELAAPGVLAALRQGRPGALRVEHAGRSYAVAVEPEAEIWKLTIESAGVAAAVSPSACAAEGASGAVAIGVMRSSAAVAMGGGPRAEERRALPTPAVERFSPRLSAVRTPAAIPSIQAAATGRLGSPPPVGALAHSSAAETPAVAAAPARRPSRPEVPAVAVAGRIKAPALDATRPSAPPPAVEYAAVGDYPRVVDRMLARMHALGASDLHLSSGSPPSVRLHGSIRPLDGFPAATGQELIARLFEVTPEKNRLEFEERSDTDFAHMMPGVARFRANLFLDRHGPAAVFRAIPFHILSPEELGLPPRVLDLCDLTKGLVVVTGPTGSGKSTTLASLVDHVNKTRDDHIITIEDPIEFLHDSKRCLVHQREVHSHTRSFKDALRAALREDPDIVLVGELRDLETVAVAIETAETGHLVFGTLHTNTAPSTVDRIIDQFSSDRQDQIRQMLAESLRGVIAQTLCKKIGGGRVAAYEVLMGSSAVSNLIRERKTFQLWSLMQTGRAHGMVTLNDSLMELVKKGLVEPREAYRKAVNKAELKTAFAREGIRLDEKE